MERCQCPKCTREAPKMSGPCLCGDPECPHCGTPGGYAEEAAAEAAIEALSLASLTPDEYRLAVAIGIAAVLALREDRNAHPPERPEPDFEPDDIPY
jgi:hypothetical protein